MHCQARVDPKRARGGAKKRVRLDPLPLGQYSQYDLFAKEDMATTVSAARAKAEFAECIRKAEAGDPVVITRHGKAVVALVRVDRLQQLERLRSAGAAAGLAGLAGGWRGSGELVRLLAGSRRTKARHVPRPGR